MVSEKFCKNIFFALRSAQERLAPRFSPPASEEDVIRSFEHDVELAMEGGDGNR